MAGEKSMLVVFMLVAICLAGVVGVWWLSTQTKNRAGPAPEPSAPRIDRAEAQVPDAKTETPPDTGQPSDSSKPLDTSKVVVELSRNPNADEEAFAQVTVGALPKGARVIVRTESGEFAGSISPFGERQRALGGTHMIPIPREAIHDGKVTLRLEVVEGPANSTRAPVPDEIKDVQITLATVTRTDPEPRDRSTK